MDDDTPDPTINLYASQIGDRPATGNVRVALRHIGAVRRRNRTHYEVLVQGCWLTVDASQTPQDQLRKAWAEALSL